MQRLIELWNETPDFTFLQKLGIGLMCLAFGIAFYAVLGRFRQRTRHAAGPVDGPAVPGGG